MVLQSESAGRTRAGKSQGAHSPGARFAGTGAQNDQSAKMTYATKPKSAAGTMILTMIARASQAAWKMRLLVRRRRMLRASSPCAAGAAPPWANESTIDMAQ